MEKEDANPLIEILRKHGRIKSGAIEICTIEKPVTFEELQEKLILGTAKPKFLETQQKDSNE